MKDALYPRTDDLITSMRNYASAFMADKTAKDPSARILQLEEAHRLLVCCAILNREYAFEQLSKLYEPQK